MRETLNPLNSPMKKFNSLSYNAGKLTVKYWYILVIIFLIYIFYPTDHMDNCVKQVMQKGNNNEKVAVNYCAFYKKNHPEIFKYWKGLIYDKI
jgi:hypothetical protein